MCRYILLTVFMSLVSCSGSKNSTNIEWIQNMMKQVSLKAQQEHKGIGPMTPPEGTRPLNVKDYPYANDLNKAIRNLKNPYNKTSDKSIFILGKRSYQKACIYCHSSTGDGNGSMKSLMIVRPPSLLTPKVRKMSDGQIYHIIHEGQGLMGSYRLQVRTEKERWALVYYIRNLQKILR